MQFVGWALPTIDVQVGQCLHPHEPRNLRFDKELAQPRTSAPRGEPMMDLTPEEKAVGKSNFQSAIGVTRREFLEGAVAAGVVSGAGLGSFYYGYKKVENPVRIGVIGTGDEGGVLLGAHTPDYLNVVAIADIRPYNVHRAFHGDPTALAARPGLMAKYGWKTEDEARKHVKVYG